MIAAKLFIELQWYAAAGVIALGVSLGLVGFLLLREVWNGLTRPQQKAPPTEVRGAVREEN